MSYLTNKEYRERFRDFSLVGSHIQGVRLINALRQQTLLPIQEVSVLGRVWPSIDSEELRRLKLDFSIWALLSKISDEKTNRDFRVGVQNDEDEILLRMFW